MASYHRCQNFFNFHIFNFNFQFSQTFSHLSCAFQLHFSLVLQLIQIILCTDCILHHKIVLTQSIRKWFAWKVRILAYIWEKWKVIWDIITKRYIIKGKQQCILNKSNDINKDVWIFIISFTFNCLPGLYASYLVLPQSEVAPSYTNYLWQISHNSS